MNPINNYRFGAYALFAMGLINLRYQTGSEGNLSKSSLLIAVGAVVLALTFIPKLNDFFMKKYKSFSLNSCANFASDWTKDFLKFDFNNKITLHDLKDIEVHKSMFSYFEQYGIALVATKLQEEKQFDKDFLCNLITQKLKELTNTKEGLSKLKNMLRITVENAPYSPEILFSDYKSSLSDLFVYFGNEPWCK